MKSPTQADMRSAIQALALRRKRDERWVRRIIKQHQRRTLACLVCNVVVASFKRLMER